MSRPRPHPTSVLASLDALPPGAPRANAARAWAARIRALSPGSIVAEALAASLERAAWRGELRAALPWLAALAAAGEAAATWSPETAPARVETPA